MRKCELDFKIPDELMGEDVYDTLYIFDNKEEAVNYIESNYDIDMKRFLLELHEEDGSREIYGRADHLRSSGIHGTLILSELMNGQYILWDAY